MLFTENVLFRSKVQCRLVKTKRNRLPVNQKNLYEMTE